MHGCPASCRCGGTTTVLLVMVSSGLLAAAVVAGDVSPRWAEVEPSCVTEGTQLKAVCSEVCHRLPDSLCSAVARLMQMSSGAPG